MSECSSFLSHLISFLLGFVAIGSIGFAASQEPPGDPILRNVDQLRHGIAQVLNDHQVPGGAVALVSPNGILWSAEFGITSRTTYRDVTSDTIFRCGSISKSFVALAVLRLQEEGKLALNDKVADLASDVSFANPWENSQPLRLVHLLEHTSGFNEQSARGFSVSILNVGLRDSLSFDAQARRCRWRPGEFFSYSNVNYELAAYIIEKVSGQAFDQYLHQNVLVPLNMKSASFLYTESVREGLANGHRDDGLTVVPYEHMLGRASGALNSTSLDLAHLVQLLLNRGVFNGSRVFTSESIERMERPVTGLVVRHGMQVGYGLGNYVTYYNGFRFHGHSGRRFGFVARYAYNLENGLGYVAMLNVGNRQPIENIEKLILSHVSREWTLPSVPSSIELNENSRSFSGYYEPYALRNEEDRFLARLVGIQRVVAEKSGLQVYRSGETTELLLPLDGNGLFRREIDSDATVAMIELEGDLFLFNALPTGGYFRRIPAAWVWFQRVILMFVLAMICSSILFALVWLPRKVLGYLRETSHLSVRILPLLAGLTIVTAFLIATIIPIDRLGLLNIWSAGICVLTWLFAVLTVAGLIQVLRARNWNVNACVWFHSLFTSIANAIALAYLSYWSVIGMRTWA